MTAARAPRSALSDERVPPGFRHNVADLVAHFGAATPATRALVDMATGESKTFAAFAADVDAHARAFVAAGLRPGDRCAVFVKQGISFVTTVFGLFRARVVPVLIDPGMGVDNMVACIKEQQPVGLVGVLPAHVLRVVKRAAFASVRCNILVGGGVFPGAVRLTSLLRQSSSIELPLSDDDTALAAVLYTSGSTGVPKGVLYTHRMIAAQTDGIRLLFAIQPGEVDVACFLPFALFSVGMGMTAVFPKMDFRYPKKADPQHILHALEGATSAFASPALWRPFVDALQKSQHAPLRLKRVLTAGAPVPPALFRDLLQFLPDGDVYTPYGATEALPVAMMSGRAVVSETASRTDQGHGLCVGMPAPGVEVRIIALHDGAIGHIDEAAALLANDIGEIIVRGACVTRAYDELSPRGRDANTLAKIVDGNTIWHRMGDAGYLDDSGRLWFCGRKAHRVCVGDRVLHSIPVEATVEAFPPHFTALVKCALVGPKVNGRVEPTIIVEVQPGQALDVSALLRAIQATAAAASVARVVVYDGPLPVDRRHNAKIEREALLKWVQQQLDATRVS